MPILTLKYEGDRLRVIGTVFIAGAYYIVSIEKTIDIWYYIAIITIVLFSYFIFNHEKFRIEDDVLAEKVVWTVILLLYFLYICYILKWFQSIIGLIILMVLFSCFMFRIEDNVLADKVVWTIILFLYFLFVCYVLSCVVS